MSITPHDIAKMLDHSTLQPFLTESDIRNIAESTMVSFTEGEIIAMHYDGEFALSEVGASYPITMIFLAFATGGSAGASVVAARLFGAKEIRQLKTAVYTTLIAFSVLAAVLTLSGLILSAPMLQLLGTPVSIMPNSDAYLKIYIAGLLFLFLYNACNGIFTALGDSKTPLFFLIG